MPLKRLSRRRFALTAGTAATTVIARGQTKKNDKASPREAAGEAERPPVEPCVRNSAISDFQVPMSTEPAFRFQA